MGGFLHHNGMDEQPLILTNPHFQDPQKYQEQLITNGMSSTAIEIGEISEEIQEALRNYKIDAAKSGKSARYASLESRWRPLCDSPILSISVTNVMPKLLLKTSLDPGCSSLRKTSTPPLPPQTRLLADPAASYKFHHSNIRQCSQ